LLACGLTFIRQHYAQGLLVVKLLQQNQVVVNTRKTV
jgi:hypothetical protein